MGNTVIPHLPLLGWASVLLGAGVFYVSCQSSTFPVRDFMRMSPLPRGRQLKFG